MSKVSKPSNKVMVFDPVSGTSQEAATTDVDEMASRAKKAMDKAKKEKAERNK